MPSHFCEGVKVRLTQTITFRALLTQTGSCLLRVASIVPSILFVIQFVLRLTVPLLHTRAGTWRCVSSGEVAITRLEVNAIAFVTAISSIQLFGISGDLEFCWLIFSFVLLSVRVWGEPSNCALMMRWRLFPDQIHCSRACQFRCLLNLLSRPAGVRSKLNPFPFVYIRCNTINYQFFACFTFFSNFESWAFQTFCKKFV